MLNAYRHCVAKTMRVVCPTVVPDGVSVVKIIMWDFNVSAVRIDSGTE